MRQGRLPQNTFDRIFGKTLSGKAAERMKTPTGIVLDGDRAITTVQMVTDSEADVMVCFYRAITRLKAYGAVPDTALINMCPRRRDSESRIRQTVVRLQDMCQAHNIAMHLSAVDTLGDMRVLTVTIMGMLNAENYKPACGSKICFAGYSGMSGTLKLLEQKAEFLSGKFSEKWLETAREQLIFDCEDIFENVKDEKALFQPVSEGGILAALWDMKVRTGTGFVVNQLEIPFKQSTLEICESLELNPYRLSGDGGMLIVCEDAEGIGNRMLNEGIPFTVLGELTKDKSCILTKKDENTCLDRPDQDEIWQINNIKEDNNT